MRQTTWTPVYFIAHFIALVRPVSRAEVTDRLSLPDVASAHAREIVGSFGPQ